MSFGFSVGDFIAVSKLTSDIVSCLRTAEGSKTEYQEFGRELELLQHALSHLDRLSSHSPSTNLDSIKYAAVSCKQLLEDFLSKIRKYEKSLGLRASSNILKSGVDKVRWAFCEEDEITKLQAYLNRHVGTINMLLTQSGFEKMDAMTETVEACQLQLQENLDETSSMVARMSDSVSDQAIVLHSTYAMVGKLVTMLAKDVPATCSVLVGMVSKVCVTTQQTYLVMLEIRDKLVKPPDTRWTFFQEPLVIEDAFGRIFPVPSEYDYDLLDSIVRQKFRSGVGSNVVAVGNYELLHSFDGSTISKFAPLRPGMRVTMALTTYMSPTGPEMCCLLDECRSGNVAFARPGEVTW